MEMITLTAILGVTLFFSGKSFVKSLKNGDACSGCCSKETCCSKKKDGEC